MGNLRRAALLERQGYKGESVAEKGVCGKRGPATLPFPPVPSRLTTASFHWYLLLLSILFSAAAASLADLAGGVVLVRRVDQVASDLLLQ